MYDEFESIVRALSERSTAFERRIAGRRIARRRADAGAARVPDIGAPTEPLTVIPQPRYTAEPLPEPGWSR